MKRRIKQNAWGNVKAYVGKTGVHDFGTDMGSALDWVEFGEWIGTSPDLRRIGEDCTFWLEGHEMKWRFGVSDWAVAKYPAKQA